MAFFETGIARARKRSARTLVVALLVTVLPLAVLAQTSPQLPNPGKTLSRETQEKLGLQAMAEVYKQMPVLPDSNPVSKYVQELGQKLQGAIPADQSWPYQFHVVQQKEINAFALPGGPIFINIGTIQAAANEGELAGVMSHEMSHVYMQHSAKQIAKAQWTGLIAGLAGAVTGDSAIGTLARAGIQFGAGSVLMHYSRKDEAQADSVGAIIAYKTGYNPKAMADFFVTLEKKYGNGGPQFLSDHPNPGNRETAIQKEVQNWPSKQYLAGSDGFTRAREEAANVKAYSGEEIAQGAKQGLWAQQNRRSGATPANLPATEGDLSNVTFAQVRPSDSFVEARRNGFSIEHPDNWWTNGGASSFLIAPPAGVSQAGIAYGVIIGAAPDANRSLDEATHQVIQTLLQENPGMRALEEIRSIEIGEGQGRSIYLSGKSPVQENGDPLPERDWLVTMLHPQGGLMYLVFVAPENEFHHLQPVYARMLGTLKLR
jgi:Zn-dependent protease with chaperone function